MYCPRCGNQSAPQSSFCSVCGAAIAASASRRIVRPRHPRMIAGVCSGFAMHFGWDVALVRIALVVITCITTGCGILVYLAAWFLLPEEPYALPPATEYTGPQQNSAV